MAKSIRKQLADKLAPLLPGVKIVPASRNLDNLTQPVLQLSLRELSRLKDAPIGAHRADFIVTIVTPITTPQRAEDDLDALVADLVAGIDSLDGIGWETATKVTYADRYLAYDVVVFATATKN